jgi:hypothetical protein
MGTRRPELERARTAFAMSGNGGRDPEQRTLMDRLQRFLRLRA